MRLALLFGCSGFHPVESKRLKSGNFLRKVQRHCGTLSIGGYTVTFMFAMNTSEPLFVSWSRAPRTGDISREKYAKTINGLYQSSNNDAVICCILRQVDSSGK